MTNLPVEKTILGIIPNINDVLSNFEYLPKTHRARVEKYFLDSKFEGIKSFSAQYRDALHVSISTELQEKIAARCCEGKIGGFYLIPWAKDGHALLMVKDSLFIAYVWVGFIPLDSLPTIKSE